MIFHGCLPGQPNCQGDNLRLILLVAVSSSCQKWNGQKMAPHTTFSRKKRNGVPVLIVKNSTLLPKMELLFILKKVPVLAAKYT